MSSPKVPQCVRVKEPKTTRMAYYTIAPNQCPTGTSCCNIWHWEGLTSNCGTPSHCDDQAKHQESTHIVIGLVFTVLVIIFLYLYFKYRDKFQSD